MSRLIGLKASERKPPKVSFIKNTVSTQTECAGIVKLNPLDMSSTIGGRQRVFEFDPVLAPFDRPVYFHFGPPGTELKPLLPEGIEPEAGELS